MGDVVVLGAHRVDVERAHLAGAELLDLPVGGEDAGAVGPDLAALADGAELQREPEDAREVLEGLTGLDPPRGLAHQAIETVAFFVDDCEQFFAVRFFELPVRQQRFGRGLDGSERRAELMRDGIE